eukprot:TRINITY_DN19463_c0_g1_i1.p1 TRINITY_DN19463_c0_g1~~TRINITY_DN19463_c0_g1_i1.p1  ORF type:complete len:374 (-),score=137.08 TRINITY_DN19463_c0_g1_i1:120-1241(-)
MKAIIAILFLSTLLLVGRAVNVQETDTLFGGSSIESSLAELSGTEYQPLIEAFLQGEPTENDRKQLFQAFDEIIKALQEMGVEEDASFAKAKGAFDKFSSEILANLNAVTKQVNANRALLFDELRPQEARLQNQIETTGADIADTNNKIVQEEKSLENFKEYAKAEDKNLRECIDAIDRAVSVLETLTKATPVFLEDVKNRLKGIFEDLKRTTADTRFVTSKHLIAVMSQIATTDDALTKGQAVDKILSLLAKVRTKLVEKLGLLAKQVTEHTETRDKMVKQYNELLVTLNENLQKYSKDLESVQSQIEALLKVLKANEETQANWQTAHDNLVGEMNQAFDIYEGRVKDFNDQITLVKKAIKICEDGGLERAP